MRQRTINSLGHIHYDGQLHDPNTQSHAADGDGKGWDGARKEGLHWLASSVLGNHIAHCMWLNTGRRRMRSCGVLWRATLDLNDCQLNCVPCIPFGRSGKYVLKKNNNNRPRNKTHRFTTKESLKVAITLSLAPCEDNSRGTTGSQVKDRHTDGCRRSGAVQ